MPQRVFYPIPGRWVTSRVEVPRVARAEYERTVRHGHRRMETADNVLCDLPIRDHDDVCGVEVESERGQQPPRRCAGLHGHVNYGSFSG